MHQISQCELHVSSYNYHLLDDKAILKNHRCGNSDFLSKNIEVCAYYKKIKSKKLKSEKEFFFVW